MENAKPLRKTSTLFIPTFFFIVNETMKWLIIRKVDSWHLAKMSTWVRTIYLKEIINMIFVRWAYVNTQTLIIITKVHLTMWMTNGYTLPTFIHIIELLCDHSLRQTWKASFGTIMFNILKFTWCARAKDLVLTCSLCMIMTVCIDLFVNLHCWRGYNFSK